MKKAATKETKSASVKTDELKNLRSQVAGLNNCLAESERRFLSVFHKVASGVIISDQAGRVIMANAPAIALLSLPDGYQGNKLADGHVKAGLSLNRVSLGEPRRVEIPGPDGRRRLLSAVTEAVNLAEGKGLITFIKDLSAVHRDEERRRRAEQLAYAGELAARLSHEIKNPLATIQTGLKLISRHGGLQGENQETLDTIASEVESIISLLHGLLNTARSDPFEPDLYELSSYVRDACSLFFSMGKGRNRLFRVMPIDQSLRAVLDRKSMSRALGNLIHNAMDAVAEGGRVDVSVELMGAHARSTLFPGFPGEVIRLRVTDNGPGIEPALRKRVFDPFYTSKETGTGLGLAVAQDVVESHGGVIRVSDAPGGGAAMEIFLVSGQRPPCWEWEVYHEWESFYETDRCSSCEVKRAGKGYLCWNTRIKEENAEDGIYLERCSECPVFLAGNLTVHYRGEV